MLHEEDLHLAFGEAVAAGRPGSGADCEVICTLKTKSNRKKTGDGAGLGTHGPATVTDWLDNPRFSALVEDEDAEGNAAADSQGGAAAAVKVAADLGAALRGVAVLDQAQAERLIEASFIRKLETALRKGTGTIDAGASLAAVGLDSVLAVEMRFWFLKAIAVEIPVLKIMNQSVAQISKHAAGEYLAQREER
ncbi:hypothetical protein LZ30DRAFT_703862 [Colletotrichum cereale]|nr:hypothetical protein LZ30DRAFT_703862 [Colletotrichum cereale]